jgi:hypothetical protein
MATISWLTNTNVIVDGLDRKYAESLKNMKDVYSRFYPLMDFQGSLHINSIRENRFHNEKTAMLFSGGLDSTSLYIQKRHFKPKLLTIFGAVIPVNNRKMIKRIKKAYTSFAKAERVKINFIETNLRQVINEARITARYAKYLPRSRGNKSWWEAVNHGPILLSLCSLAAVDDISEIMVASSRPVIPHGSHPKLTKSLEWGDVKVSPGGFGYDRREKVKKVLKPFIIENQLYPPLQLCNYAPVVSEQFNCGTCEKCVRNIIELTLAGIDPRKCGFPIIKDFHINIKKNVVKEIIAPRYWVNFQKEAHKVKAFAKNEKFLKWMIQQDFTKTKALSLFELSRRWASLSLYSNFPTEVQMEILTKLYHHRYVKKVSNRI